MREKASIFTLGYQKRSLPEFIDELGSVQVSVVVDVRETAWSYKKGFSKSALSEGLRSSGIDYIHAKFAGNPKEIRDGADSPEECLIEYEKYLASRPEIIEELTSLLLPLMDEGEKVCLMCYERHPGDCHRSILLDHWTTEVNRTVSVVHLAPEGAERFTKRGAPTAG